jgi:hypothetical protein
MIAIIDQKYINIYKNDKGNTSKVYHLNMLNQEIRIAANSLLFFSRDSLLIISKSKIRKVSIRTSNIETIRMPGKLTMGGHTFIDSMFFYFLTTDKTDDCNAKINVLSSEMIDAALASH